MKLLGVIGNPIGHSLSHVMHNAAFQTMGMDAVYVPMLVEEHRLGEAIMGARALGFTGINVTVPYKEKVIPYLTDLTQDARRTNSVNTIRFHNDQIIGHSTDGPGFAEAVTSELGISLTNKRFLVLGAGGAARAIVQQLLQLDCQLLIANRTMLRAKELLQEIEPSQRSRIELVELQADALAKVVDQCDIIVNTTTVGMQDTITQSPMPIELLLPSHSVIDIIYNPQETRLLREARARGCQTRNGVGMLVWQAVKAWEFWWGITPNVDVMYAAVENALNSK